MRRVGRNIVWLRGAIFEKRDGNTEVTEGRTQRAQREEGVEL